MSGSSCVNGQHWFGFSDEPQDTCTCGEWLYSGAWGWHPTIELGSVAEWRMPFFIRPPHIEQVERGPDYLIGLDGEAVFIRRDLAETLPAALAYGLTQGMNLAAFDADEVEMLPIPEHFTDIDFEWGVVVPGTPGAAAFWRFLA